MNAYKCDICGKYFEDGYHQTGSIYSYSEFDTGHHELGLTLTKGEERGDWQLFKGDICPDCMGYFCVGLCERGCQDKNIKMYAADYIRKVRNERMLDEEVKENDKLS